MISSGFETGVNAADIATGDAGNPTAWDVVDKTGTGATVTYDNTQIKNGSLAAKLYPGTAAWHAHLAWTTAFGSQTDHYGRLYIYVASGWSTTAFMSFYDNTPTLVARALITGTRTVMIQDTNLAGLATSTTALTLNAWNRIEWHVVAGDGTGTWEMKLFVGGNVDGATPDQTFSASSMASSTAHTQARFGVLGADPVTNMWLDDVVAAHTSYPGPYSVGGIVKTGLGVIGRV